MHVNVAKPPKIHWLNFFNRAMIKIFFHSSVYFDKSSFITTSLDFTLFHVIYGLSLRAIKQNSLILKTDLKISIEIRIRSSRFAFLEKQH